MTTPETTLADPVPAPVPFAIEVFDPADRADKGRGRVEVDGQDVTNLVSGVAFEADASTGGVARVHLALRPGLAGSVTGVAVVDAALSAQPEADGAVFAAVEAEIRRLDPAEVAAMVAARSSSMADDPAKIMLEVIADLFKAAVAAP